MDEWANRRMGEWAIVNECRSGGVWGYKTCMGVSEYGGNGVQINRGIKE